jgi:predicted metal-dependent hydrolase
MIQDDEKNSITNATIDWPPDYTIRTHHKAKHIRLNISDKGLVITLPRYCPQQEAINFLEAKRSWVEKHLSAALSKSKPAKLIQEINLLSIEQVWNVNYCHSQSALLRIQKKPNQQLIVHGDAQSHTLTSYKLLKRWLQRQAQLILPEWIDRISKETLLPFNRLSIRGQKTRWGSCSADNNISLNYKLLLLHKEIVDYIIIHELCHTVHHHHGEAFWNLVEVHCHNYQESIRQLKIIERQLPNWLTQ